MPNISLEDKDKIVEDYKNGMSSPKLAEKYGVSKPTILKWLRRWGVDTSEKSHVDYKNSKYTFNEHWLDEIDSQEKAYFLGFFYADGNVKDGRNSDYGIRIKLKREDRYILERFQSLFESTKPIMDTENFNRTYNAVEVASCFEVTSKYIWNRMQELGCPPAKTLILKFPNFIPKKYMNSFIRGYFDGDGNISLREYDTLANIRICGTEDMCKGIFNEVLKHTGVKGIYYKDKAGRKMWLYDIANQRDIKNFLDWIYLNSNIHLIRKKEKVDRFLTTRDFDKETQMEISKRVRTYTKEIIQQFKDGTSQNQIGRNFNCSSFTIHRILQENNII